MLGFIIFLGVMSLVLSISFICIFYFEYQSRKFVKNHPKYIELKNKVIEVGNATWEWRNLINQKKKAIDEQLAELPYLTATARAKAEAEIGELRVELEQIRNEAEPYFEEHLELREKLNSWHEELVKNGELKEFY